jgi:ADP-heptose:LPS heptosyltransferase
MRILIIHLRSLGDMLLSTPLLRALRRRYPGARLECLARPASVAALVGNPNVDELLIWQPNLLNHFREMVRLRKRGYDIVIDFHSAARTAMLVWATRAAHRIGQRSSSPCDWVYTHLLPPARDTDHLARAWLNFAAPLAESEQLGNPRLEITIGNVERAWAEAVWHRFGLVRGQPVVAVSPVSKEYYKQWGADRWAQVADAIQDAGYSVLITHGPDEHEQAEAVVRRMRTQPAWGHGPTTLGHLAALYERCVLWVGNDGGAKHVATAAGTPTVAVHRWATGARFTDTSPGSPHRFLEHAPRGGCDRRCYVCPHLACLQQVSVNEVLKAVRASLPSGSPLLPG